MKKYSWILLMSALSLTASAQEQTTRLLVGTYTAPGMSEGIYSYDFNSAEGSSALKGIAKGIANPSYLTISPDHQFAYAVNETGESSTISSYKYDHQTGALTLLNKVNSQGADPCYLTADDQYVIAANYSGGSLAVFSRKADGSLSEAIQVIRHKGKSIDPKGRQKSAHVHMTMFTPDHRYVVVNDLGEDKVYLYQYQPEAAEKILTEHTVFNVTPGSGPRHLTFSPNGQFAYLANEFSGIITVFAYHDGHLKKLQEIGTTPKDFKGAIDAADIHTSADGKFLYETNRGDANTISAFEILPDGQLRWMETISTMGKGPRNFSIDPSGKFLLVAHQYTNNIVVFNRDVKTGKLTDSGKKISVGAPVCLIFDQHN